MILKNLDGRQKEGFITFGSIWNKSAVKRPYFQLQDSSGTTHPLQSTVTAWWPDGSVKWASHTVNSTKLSSSIEIIPCEEKQQFTGIQIKETDTKYLIDAGRMKAEIPKPQRKSSKSLVENVTWDGKQFTNNAYPVFLLERRDENQEQFNIKQTFHRGAIDKVDIEESGPLQCILRFSGTHLSEDDCSMPFIIRMYINLDSKDIRFVHTFLFDGVEERDFLKGMGIRFEVPLKGNPYNRHIKFVTDSDKCLHEASMMLVSKFPPPKYDYLKMQMQGQPVEIDPKSDPLDLANNLPIWNRYCLTHDSAANFTIKKQTENSCCEIDVLNGGSTDGTMSVTGECGGVYLSVKDFWQKFPSGLETDSFSCDTSLCTAWFYSPSAAAMDFRHYSKKSYPNTSYEGFDFIGASAYGIAVTSECCLTLTESFPTDNQLISHSKCIQNPPVYVGTPEYYHSMRAFGYWSLPKTGTQVESVLEKELNNAVDFYINEIKQRSWYGLFNYGDVMHTYDGIRNCWKYDIGGFAWDNTELVPTYWLWYYFMRTGREDVFTLAEAMSRHCSEVDIYHFGDIQGLGSRHNVRHWGCSCKEPRVAMAGHHRPYYYLTGDRRIGDVMDDVKDADLNMGNTLYRKLKFSNPENNHQIRSGPDWSSFVSNWMTVYERTLDSRYRDKIEKGIEGIAAAPAGLCSGPGYDYNPETGTMTYTGETISKDTHLSVCMGGPQIWFETADMLESETLRKLVRDFGKFYFYTPEYKNKKTENLIGDRKFNIPYVASAMAASAAKHDGDDTLAQVVWRVLLKAAGVQADGAYRITGNGVFIKQEYAVKNDKTPLYEIPWISTNFSAQWCLNVLVALDFIRDALPETLNGLKEFLDESNPDIYVQE